MSRSQAWKDHERATAKALGGQRVKRMGDFGESKPDVEHEHFSIECKFRKQLPKLVTEGLKQAKAYDKSKVPLLVLKERNMRGAIVCITREDFMRLLNEKSREPIPANNICFP